MDNAYQWEPFYEALADKLLTYNDKRDSLFDLMRKAASEQPLMQYLHFENADWWDHQIDPFSVMGVMNRSTSDTHRTALAEVIASTFGIALPAPTEFTGIPVLNNRKSFFAGVDEVWSLFIAAMNASATDEFNDEFTSAFDTAVAVRGNGLTYITMGLYWMRPNTFMPLDSNSRAFIAEQYGIATPNRMSGNNYVSFLRTLREKAGEQSLTFPEISYAAWQERGESPNVASVQIATDNVSRQPAQADTFRMDKNILLYGTPGTGKTYSTVQYAVAIIEEKPLTAITSEDYDAVFARYLAYKDDGLVAFTTFHQSFGYEEFIEGIRPVVASEDQATRAIEYEIHDGVFKQFCDSAGTPVGNNPSTDLLRKVQPSLFTQQITVPNRVFIIDEINRGNISKIFGELITLIEPSKRIGAQEQLRVILPYSGQNFGVPSNVYIIGTMNTADRSIALIDTALRRRFSFVEMVPDSSVLADVLVNKVVDVAEMLDTINKRITVLLDREHTIGHSYFLPLKSDPTIERLAQIFEGKIIPLLQEYFYDDYEKIQLVLGDNQKPDDSTRFIVKNNDAMRLFGNADIDFPDYYVINKGAFMRIDAYAFM